MVKSAGSNPVILETLAEDFEKLLGSTKDAISHIASEDSGRPSCLMIHPNFGVIAIEVGRKGESTSETRIRLNQKVESLRRQLASPTDLVIQNIVIATDSNSDFEAISKTSFVVGNQKISQVDWKVELKKSDLKSSEIGKLRNRLWPAMAFRVETYEGTTETNREERDASRAILDAEQAKIALAEVDQVMVISGPPGSGKSLVLAARAKFLAAKHPEWKIVLVVYNRMLAKHFLASEDKWPKNVEIVTLKKFLEKRGEETLARLSSDYRDPEEALEQATKFVKELKKKRIESDLDALLVDEWQDFKEPYIEYLLACVREGHGGAVFAGDSGQAIYTDGLPNKAIKQVEVKKVQLKVPYRSTRQILDVAQALDSGYLIKGSEGASDGEPVSLIFATTWKLQADAIAWEIGKLIDSGQRAYGEIVVLCTTKGGANAVERALNENGIPNVVHSRIWDESNISHEKVNVMTIHGGKGFGFKVVFVMGFETLRDLDGSKERSMWGRVGYVAVTRAEDLLFILYKTETQFMRNLKKCKKETLVSRSFPDDYKNMRK